MNDSAGGDGRPDPDRADCRVLHDIGRAAAVLFSDTKHIYTSPARTTTRNALWLGGILAVGGLVYAYDQDIYEAFHRNRNHKLYKQIRMLGEQIEPAGHMGNTNRYYFGTLLFGYLVGINSISSISAQILESHFIAGGVKNVANIAVGRRRPHEGLGPRSFEFNDGTSFPSGHTSNAFQFATIASRHIRFMPFQVLAYSLATVIGFERITSDGHWPSDVYFAAVLGTVVSREVLNLHERRKVTVIPVIENGDTGLQVAFSFQL